MVGKVKFFLTPFYVPDNYSPEAIALAEGLKELGIEVCANIDYWYSYDINDYLLKENESNDYDVGIYDYKYLYHSKKWTLSRVDTSKINVLLDRNDWLDQEWRDQNVLDKFNYILVDHMLRGFDYPQKVKPWAIGITHRIKYYIDKVDIKKEDISKQRILSNSRMPHNLRRKIQDGLSNNISSDYVWI